MHTCLHFRSGFELHSPEQFQRECRDATKRSKDWCVGHWRQIPGRRHCQLSEPAWSGHWAVCHRSAKFSSRDLHRLIVWSKNRTYQTTYDYWLNLCCLGVKNADENELRSIASDPDDIHMYNVADFSFLLDIVDRVTDNLCNSVKGPGMYDFTSEYAQILIITTHCIVWASDSVPWHLMRKQLKPRIGQDLENYCRSFPSASAEEETVCSLIKLKSCYWGTSWIGHGFRVSVVLCCERGSVRTCY